MPSHCRRTKRETQICPRISRNAGEAEHVCEVTSETAQDFILQWIANARRTGQLVRGLVGLDFGLKRPFRAVTIAMSLLTAFVESLPPATPGKMDAF